MPRKVAGLAAIADGKPIRAIRIFLTGSIPGIEEPKPAGHSGPWALKWKQKPQTLSPIVVFHVIILHKVDAWTVDADLEPLEGLRAHLPEYFGQIVVESIAPPGVTWRCECHALAAQMCASGSWRTTPLDVENHGYRVAINALHGATDASDVVGMAHIPTE